MPEAHKVAELAQVKAQQRLAVKLGELELALFFDGGEVLATAGRCPHANGFLHRGSVCEGKVTCPWHGWTWNLRTGECDESDELALPRYPVRIEGDEVFVLL